MADNLAKIIDFYEILGVQMGSTLEEIRIAYREKAKLYHPDQYARNELQHLAEQEMRRVNVAYSAIIEHAKRDPTETLYSDIDQYLNTGNATDAERLLMTLQTRDTKWHVYMAAVLKLQGLLGQALNHIMTSREMAAAEDNEWVQIGDNLLDSCYQIICAKVDNNDLQEAEDILDIVNTKDALWYFIHSIVMGRKGFYDAALTSISRAHLLDPDNADITDFKNELVSAQIAYKSNHKEATSGTQSNPCGDICGGLCFVCAVLDCICG